MIPTTITKKHRHHLDSILAREVDADEVVAR